MEGMLPKFAVLASRTNDCCRWKKGPLEKCWGGLPTYQTKNCIYILQHWTREQEQVLRTFYDPRKEGSNHFVRCSQFAVLPTISLVFVVPLPCHGFLFSLHLSMQYQNILSMHSLFLPLYCKLRGLRSYLQVFS